MYVKSMVILKWRSLMAKKKVMKTVSVPTLQEVEVATCDICGKDVGEYRDWETSPLQIGRAHV